MVLGRCQNCNATVHEGEGYMIAKPRVGREDSNYAGEIVGFDHEYFHHQCPELPASDPAKRKVQGT